MSSEKHERYFSLARRVGRLLRDNISAEQFKEEATSAFEGTDQLTAAYFIQQHHLVPYFNDRAEEIKHLDYLYKTVKFYHILHSKRRAEVQRKLCEVAHILDYNCIKYLHVKGFSIEHHAYRGTTRQFNDIDLLIDPYSADKFKQLMVQRGSSVNLDKKVMPSSEITYSNVLVDAHYDSFFANFNTLYSRHSRMKANECYVPVPAAEDLFIYTCCHLSLVHRYWPLLSWIYDVYRFIRTNQLDWDYIKNRGMRHQVLELVKRAISATAFFIDPEIRPPLRPYSFGPLEPSYNSMWKGRQDSRIMTELGFLHAYKQMRPLLSIYSRRLYYKLASFI